MKNLFFTLSVLSAFLFQTCNNSDDEQSEMTLEYPITYSHVGFSVENEAYFQVAETDLEAVAPSEAFRYHMNQFLIQDLLPDLSDEFLLKKLTLTSDSTVIVTTYDFDEQTTIETSRTYIRDGDRLLFPNTNVPWTIYLTLNADESELHWCDFYFAHTFFDLGSGELEYSGFEQYTCFMLDDDQPFQEYRMNNANLAVGDTLAVVTTNQILVLEE